jgi:hypothetical protein
MRPRLDRLGMHTVSVSVRTFSSKVRQLLRVHRGSWWGRQKQLSPGGKARGGGGAGECQLSDAHGNLANKRSFQRSFRQLLRVQRQSRWARRNQRSTGRRHMLGAHSYESTDRSAKATTATTIASNPDQRGMASLLQSEGLNCVDS